MDREVVTASGTRVAFAEDGIESGRPMVLLHGLGESRADWDGVLGRLGQSHRTIAFDLRGHGRSDWPDSYSVALMSHDVEHALDALPVSDAVVVGHSLGGMVAFDLTARRPDLVHALVVEDVAPPQAQPPRPEPVRPDVELPFDWDVVVAIRAETDAGDAGLWAALENIHVPTLIIAGGPDSTMDQGRLLDAARRLPHGTLKTLEAGHHIQRARPDAYCDLLLDWLDVTD